MLAKRTLRSGEDIVELFLDLRGVHDPFDRQIIKDGTERLRKVDGLPKINEVAEKLKAADKIAVFGDYDADGITASAIANLYLGGKVRIPERIEGYGLNNESIDLFEPGTLVFTVDCGIKAKDVVEYGKSRGLDFIVTDHHVPDEDLVPDCLVINPILDNWEFTEISGSALAFKVLSHIYGYIEDAMQLAAIGTICDVMPMLDENRYIVKQGLMSMRYDPIVGVEELAKKMRKKIPSLTEKDIGWYIGPAINASGRTGNAWLSYRLLTTQDRNEAKELAKEIVGRNDFRKVETKRMMEVAAENAISTDSVYVCLIEGAMPGLIGLVANRISSDTGLPAVVISTEGDKSVASFRAPHWFNCAKAIRFCKDLLLSGGGHAGAGGMSFLPEKTREIIDRLIEYSYTCEVPPEIEIKADIRASIGDVVSNITRIENLAPFGEEFAQPLFVTETVMEDVKPLGTGHSQFYAEGCRALAFGMQIPPEASGTEVEIAFEAQTETFRGKKSISLIVRHIEEIL